MLMNIADKIVILHQAELQGKIWEKILHSQGLQSVILPFSVDLQGELLDLAAAQQSLPNLILLEQQLPSFDTAKFCQWMQSFEQPIPVILIAAQTRKVAPADRETAIANGAADLLPQFDLNSIAIEAVSGLKTVAKVLGNINIVNNTLVTCIMELKRELEAGQEFPVAPPAVSSNTPELKPPTPTVASPPPEAPAPKTRKYRGRDY